MLTLVVVLLIALITWLFNRHGRLAVAHPGTWFAAAWILSILSYAVLDYADAVPVHDDVLLMRLWMYVIYTTGLFFACSLLYVPPYKGLFARPREFWPPKTWEDFELPMLGSAFIGFAGSLANVILLGHGFVYSDATRQAWIASIPLVTARTWYFYIATYPASFVVGTRVSSFLLTGRKLNIALIASIFMTFGAGFLWMIGTGGRQAFGIQILYFLTGAAFGWAKIEIGAGRRLLRKIVLALASMIAVCAAFAFVINVTGSIRARDNGLQESKLAGLGGIGWGGQFFEYMGQPIATFQAYGDPMRRDLSETGPVTFSALHDFGIGWLFGWRRPGTLDTNPERALVGTSFAFATGTRNIFYDFEADFGFGGELAVLVLLVALSQISFSVFVRGNETALTGFIPLTSLLMFWGYSHQFSLYIYGDLKWQVLAFVLWDLAVYLLMPYILGRTQIMRIRTGFQKRLDS
jgi:hypothetical protein